MAKKEGNKHKVYKSKLTHGQSAADKLSLWAGSWMFIFGLLIIIGIWIALNIYMIRNQWDPYPFILLNFVLSTLAALQAPVILMSQNRQTERDRVYSKYDYQVNRKAEREIQNMQKDLIEIKKLVKRLKKR